MKEFILLTSTLLIMVSCSKKPMQKDKTPLHTNELINESSPYLLQHAHNPVDWHPWGEEALNKAKEEDKLLIISVGYAACHWCHVMEHESFEDSTVAKLMNEHFVPIKVDREERPDVDDIYMNACHLVSGRGGWPLNAFALPDGKPIWAGTYFPKKDWINLLQQFVELKKASPEKLIESAEAITNRIKEEANSLVKVDGADDFSQSELENIAADFVKQIDLVEGGRRGAPKFPMPNNPEFLLKYHALSGNKTTFEAANTSLTKMALGGIYDQIGGGFARYSVDAYWKVPHFEKMLYDNGQLISVYSQAYALTKNPLYKKTIEQTLEFVKRELTSPQGGFYSSLDADSEGEEGKFYVWTYDEAKEAIGDSSLFALATKYYNLVEQGNWEEHKNILLRKISDEAFITINGLNRDSFYGDIEKIETLLFEARKSRIRPGLDDKILTSWNGLMIKGYVDAYRVLKNEEYLEMALTNAKFILNNQIQSDNRVNRNFKEGKSTINAFLEDYAIVIDAFISIYEVTFDESWLMKADELMVYALDHFHNAENEMFNFTSDLDPPLVSNNMKLTDNVIPSPNSIMARNLKYLGELLFKENYLSTSRQMLQNVQSMIVDSKQPSFYSNWCQLYLDMTYPPYEVAIVGKNAKELRDEMMGQFLPNVIYLGGEDEGSLKLLENKLQEGETMIYVCQNKACKFPVQTSAEAIKLIQN